MEVVAKTGAIGCAKLQSNHHHQQTNTKSFFTGRMPFLLHNQQCQSTEGKISHPMDLLTPNSPGVFQLCLWPLIAPSYLGEVCHAPHQPYSVYIILIYIIIRCTYVNDVLLQCITYYIIFITMHIYVIENITSTDSQTREINLKFIKPLLKTHTHTHTSTKIPTLCRIFETVFHSANCICSPPSTIPW